MEQWSSSIWVLREISSSLPRCRSIPITELEKRFNEIRKTGTVVLYCACQTYDITHKAVFLEYREYRNIFVTPEEYQGWVKRDYLIESGRP